VLKKTHELSGRLAAVFGLIVLVYILVGNNLPLNYGRLSICGLAVIILYFVGMKVLSSLSKDYQVQDLADNKENKEQPLSHVIIKALFFAALIIISAIFLSNSADKIAETTGLGRTFVGSIFLAFATSLPEIVVSVSALKLGSIDLAIGNIFGSNMTNIFILALCGLIRQGQPILNAVSNTHALTAGVGMLLTIVILVSINKKKKTVCSVGLDSWFMLAVFLFGMSMLYNLR